MWRKESGVALNIATAPPSFSKWRLPRTIYTVIRDRRHSVTSYPRKVRQQPVHHFGSTFHPRNLLPTFCIDHSRTIVDNSMASSGKKRPPHKPRYRRKLGTDAGEQYAGSLDQSPPAIHRESAIPALPSYSTAEIGDSNHDLVVPTYGQESMYVGKRDRSPSLERSAKRLKTGKSSVGGTLLFEVFH